MESFLVARYRLAYHFRRYLAFLPADYLDAPALEILVDMEEVLHFLQIMLRKVSDVEILVVIGVMTRDCQNFVIGLTPIQHLQHSERTAIDLAGRESRLVDVDEHIEGIPV